VKSSHVQIYGKEQEIQSDILNSPKDVVDQWKAREVCFWRLHIEFLVAVWLLIDALITLA
jgi:hypothetical protein